MGATQWSVCHTVLYYFPFYREATVHSMPEIQAVYFYYATVYGKKENKLHMASSIPVPDLMFTCCVG